jgi:hypothetical protein
VTHNLITDYELGKMMKTGRKSATFTASDPNNIDFLLRRTIRHTETAHIKWGLLKGSLLPLSPSDLKTLFEKRSLKTSNLCAWPTQTPLMKFSLSRHRNVYSLTAIDEASTDSYFLKTRDWEQIKTALLNISGVKLETPAILDVYNPFGLFAPFNEPPSQVDFESVNSGLVLEIEKALEKIRTENCAGFMEGKVALAYYNAIAELQKLNAVVGLLSTPSADHFENEHLEF